MNQKELKNPSYPCRMESIEATPWAISHVPLENFRAREPSKSLEVIGSNFLERWSWRYKTGGGAIAKAPRSWVWSSEPPGNYWKSRSRAQLQISWINSGGSPGICICIKLPRWLTSARSMDPGIWLPPNSCWSMRWAWAVALSSLAP